MIYLIWGKDSFNKQLALKKITNSLEGYKIINSGEPHLDSYVNEILTDSFFDTKKAVLTTNFLAQVSKDKKEKHLIEALKKIAKETIIIFVEETEPKGTLKKYLQEVAKSKHFDKPQGRDIIDHIKARTNELNSNISPLAAERLASYVGADYWQLDEELKKLALYKIDDKEDIEKTIDVSDVDELVRSGFEANIFELMDAISQKNTNRSIALLDSFLNSGENEIYILSMIARQFRNIAMAKIENTNEATLAKKAKIHPYVAKKSVQQAQNFTKEEISQIYTAIMQADYSLKSGGDPKQALQNIILN